MKKILTLFLILTLTTGFVACGKSEVESGTETGTSDSQDVLNSDTDSLVDGSSDGKTDAQTETSATLESSDENLETDSQEGSDTPRPDGPPVEDSDEGSDEDSSGDKNTDRLEEAVQSTNTDTDTDKNASTDNSSQNNQGSGGSSGSSSSGPKVLSAAEREAAAMKILSETEHYVALCDQLNGRIILCDLAATDWNDDKAVVWEYDPQMGKENLGWIAGVKFRDCPYYGGKVMIYCYPDHARIVSMETKKTLLETGYSGVNPHSVELLPNGTLLVASTNDNWVGIYAPGATEPANTLTFPLAHGVLWDPTYQYVWIAGKQNLGAYRFNSSGTDLYPVENRQYKTPKTSVHDLAPVYGDTDSLFVTCASGIVKFNKKTGNFSYDYPGGTEYGKLLTYVPGCGNFADGVLAFTAITDATKVYQDWDTNVVHIFVPIDAKNSYYVTRKVPSDAYYKLRVYNFNYQ